MKTTKLILIIVILIMGFQTSFSQEAETKTKEQKKIEKQQAKEAAQLQEKADWQNLKTLFENKDLVFAGSVIGGTTVDPSINFIVIDGDKAVIQFANGFGGGANGIGGITLDGQIDSYKLKAGKPGKEIVLNMTVITQAGQGVRGPVNIQLSAFSFDSSRINIGAGTSFMDGRITSKADSKIFKGNTLN